MKECDWVVCDAKTQSIRCERCKAEKPLELPMAVEDWCKWAEDFTDKHRGCK